MNNDLGNYYVVLSRRGYPFDSTLRKRRASSVSAFLQIMREIKELGDWEDFYRLGYRCKRCTITLTTRKG